MMGIRGYFEDAISNLVNKVNVYTGFIHSHEIPLSPNEDIEYQVAILKDVIREQNRADPNWEIVFQGTREIGVQEGRKKIVAIVDCDYVKS